MSKSDCSNETWRIELFGGLSARRGERMLTHFETRRIGALLAYLALDLHRVHLRDVLAEELWPDENGTAVRNRLRQALSSLRRELEPEGVPSGSVLIADRADVRLDPRAVMTDVAQFEACLRSAAERTDPSERALLLRQAIELYRGDLLAGYYDNWILPERERLSEMLRHALGQLAGTLAEQGDLAGAIDLARRAVAADVLQEEAHGQLMQLYARSGRMADALRQYRELERLLRDELGSQPTARMRSLFAQLQAEITADARPASSIRPEYDASPRTLEPEGGAVPLDSAFYIVRPIDREFEEAVVRRDSIVLVKGARQVGKTSLLARGLQQAREAGARVVLTDLQNLTAAQLESPDTLFRTLAESMADQLDLDASLVSGWHEQRGWNVNFERFLRREALGLLDTPLVWGLDEVDRLFAYPFRTEVFGLFRSWHNQRSLNPAGPWGRLTMAIAYATEAHLFITDLNQSPFNVGTRLTLGDFTVGEVAELNRRYHSPLRDAAEIARYYALVGGHPYLVRRGLHAMTTQGMDVTTFETQSEREEGIFGDHLRRMLSAISQDPALCDALRAILRNEPCPGADSFYRLHSAGVIAGASLKEAIPRCRLYRSYLERHLL